MTTQKSHSSIAAPIFQSRPRPPTGRCHECGSPDTQAWCCDCHRLMCTEHDAERNPAGLLAQLRELWPLPSSVSARQSDTTASRHYCEMCKPNVDAHAGEVLAAAGLVVVGAVATLWTTLAGLSLIALGGLVLIFLVTRYLRRRGTMRGLLLRDLLIDPGINSISIIDKVAATAKLDDDQRYVVSDITVGGKLTVDAEWGDAAWGRVRNHYRRYPGSRSSDIHFAAGALVLRGPVGLTLRSADGCRLVNRSVLLLRDKVSKHPLLSSTDGRGRRNWTISAEYNITGQPGKEWKMPIWISPALVPESDRRSLDLEFQWTKFGPGDKGLPINSIDRLWIAVPATWGSVLASTNESLVRVVSPDNGTSERIIEWRNIIDIPHQIRGRYCISLTFENEIGSHDVLRGGVESRFRGNLCRITRVDLYGSNGAARRERPPKKLDTQVCLNFRLSLAGVRYQAIRVLPKPPAADQGEQLDKHTNIENHQPTQENPDTFELVIPNSETVATLTAALSNGDYYIKRVVENPPQPGKRASVVHRYWDIAGRKYDGVYPIDFHLILTGDEVHDGGRVMSGRTSVSLSVRGAYATVEMDQKVHDEWHSLRRRIEIALNASRHADRRSAAGATCEFIAELAHDRKLTESVADQIVARVRHEFGLGEY